MPTNIKRYEISKKQQFENIPYSDFTWLSIFWLIVTGILMQSLVPIELYLMDGRTFGHTLNVERVCFVKYSAKCLKKNSVINNEYSCPNFLGNFFVLLGQSIRPSIISYSLLGAQLLYMYCVCPFVSYSWSNS